MSLAGSHHFLDCASTLACPTPVGGSRWATGRWVVRKARLKSAAPDRPRSPESRSDTGSNGETVVKLRPRFFEHWVWVNWVPNVW